MTKLSFWSFWSAQKSQESVACSSCPSFYSPTGASWSARDWKIWTTSWIWRPTLRQMGIKGWIQGWSKTTKGCRKVTFVKFDSRRRVFFLFPIFIGGCYSLFEMGKTPFHLIVEKIISFRNQPMILGYPHFFVKPHVTLSNERGMATEITQLKTPMYPCCMLWFKPQQHWHSTSQTCDKVIHWLLQTSWVYISRWKDSFWSETTAPLTPDAALPIMPTAFVAEATTSTATSETTTTTTTTTRTTESASVPWRSWNLESSVPCS